MPNPLTRLTAARFDGPQALYTEARKEIEALAAENARLASSEPACAAVKPLAWEPSINNRPWHSAKAPWGWYYAQWDDETEAWFASLEMGEIEEPIILLPSDVPTIDDAKAAAQADYEARILSAITLRTEAEVRAEAWVAAIEAAANAAFDPKWKPKCSTDWVLARVAGDIRAMTTDDASASLDRIKAEARKEGMREAAQRAALMIELGADWPATTRGKVDAILAAITEVRK